MKKYALLGIGVIIGVGLGYWRGMKAGYDDGLDSSITSADRLWTPGDD